MALTGEDGSIQFTSSLLTLWDVKELSYWTIHSIFKGQQGHRALQFLQKCMLQHIGQPPRLLRVEKHQGPWERDDTHKKGAHKRKQFSKHNATSVSLVQACYITASDLNLCSITEQMHITWVLQAQTAFAQKLFQMTFQFNRPQICTPIILSVSQHTFSSPRGASSSWANSRASSTWPLRISSMRRCCCKWKNSWGFVSSICHVKPKSFKHIWNRAIQGEWDHRK